VHIAHDRELQHLAELPEAEVTRLRLLWVTPQQVHAERLGLLLGDVVRLEQLTGGLTGTRGAVEDNPPCAFSSARLDISLGW
jgi:hypothetical protein